MESVKQSQLVIEAKLLDSGEPVPLPGEAYIIPIMKYEVLRVVQGAYAHSLIFVGHKQANRDLPDFRLGIHHRLQLNQDFPASAAVLNTFQDETQEFGIYFCVSFEVL